MKIKALALFISFWGVQLTHADDSVRPSRLLLSAFSSQCPQVVTRNVTATLLNLQGLYSTVEELKKDNNCLGAVQFSNIISRYSSLFEDFETQNNDAQEKITLEKKIAMYSTLLGDPSLDSTQLSFIRSEIIHAQSSLININAGLSRFQSFSGKEAKVANQLVMAVDGFMADLQTAQGNACYKKNAARVSSLMSNALMVTAAFASGGTSLALAAGSVVVKSLGQYIGEFKYNQSLSEMNDIEMPTAFRCVSQALSDQFCSASETQALIHGRIDATNTRYPTYDGINLLSYQLNSLARWLEEAYAGSEITSQGDLVNREKPILQSEFLKKVKRYVETYGTIKRKAFAAIENDGNRSMAISQAITNIAYIMDTPSLTPAPPSAFGSSTPVVVENPIFATFSKDLIPYNLYEPGVHTSVPFCGSNPCKTFVDYIGLKGIVLSNAEWEKALTNAVAIIQSIQDQVNVDRSKTISVDAYSILVNAKRDLRGEVNPIKGLYKIVANGDRIINYLYAQGCRDLPQEECEGLKNKYSPHILNIQKTKDLTIQVINLINEGMIPRTIPDEVLPLECQKNKPIVSLQADNRDVLELKSFQITSCITRILKLDERGNDVYFSKVRNMVSYEMEARFANKDLGEGAEDVIRATRSDLITSILNSYSSKDSIISLGELDISLESAQNNSRETMNQFFDFFKKNLTRALESDKVSSAEKSDLCFRILPYLSSAKDSMLKTIYKGCQGRSMNVYKDGPTIRFDDFIKKIPGKMLKSDQYVLSNPVDVKKWFCVYRQYNRANLLLDEQIKQRQAARRNE